VDINVGYDVDYTIRAQTTGDRLDFKFWETALTEPEEWTITVFDSTYTSGGFGIIAHPGTNESSIGASFDNIVFSPEPGSGLLLGAGLTGLGTLRKRRRGGKNTQ
jgi:hypothetical protein